MQGLAEWNPVDTLWKLPVTGLNVENLLDISPPVKLAFGKAMQLETPAELRSERRAKGSSGRIVGLIDDVNTVGTEMRGRIQGVMRGVLPEPKVQFFIFHTAGEVVTYGKEKNCPLDGILIDGGAMVNLMPEKVVRKLG